MPERQSKATQGRHERMLLELLKLPGNDRCADCKAKNPRWASYSLGIFLCIRCAGLHRKMGTHISRVKSVTMDEWTLEQIDMIRKGGGNDKVNQTVNPHPDKHPLPLADDDADRAMERYIRQKWEKRAFIEQPVMPTRPTASTLTSSTPAHSLPQRSSSVPVLVRDHDDYSAAAERLREMGFKDMDRNRQVLKHTQGNLSSAVDILSRLPGAQKPILSNQHMSDDQKLMRLNALGYTDMVANRDALRRSGGNFDVALNILENAKKSAHDPITAAFSTNNSSSSDLAGRAQNTDERQAHKLSGGKTGVLLDLDTGSSPSLSNSSNPFHMQTQSQPSPFAQQQQQQQQQLPNTTNPFGVSAATSLAMSSSATSLSLAPQFTGLPQSQPATLFNNGSLQTQQMTGIPATMQPQLTGVPMSANGAMQPQLTGMANMGLSNGSLQQSQLTGMPNSSTATSLQPQLTGMPSPAMNTSMGSMPSPSNKASNPFSQMTSNNDTSNNIFANRFAMPQRSQTAPEFSTLPQQPSIFSSSPQIPQQQQQQQQQQASMMPFAGAMANQATGFSTMQNPAATTTNNNPWAGSSFF